VTDSGADAFRRVVAALERRGIPFMLTGSFASSFHGVPRATQDIDLVIAPNEGQLRTLARDLLSNEFYVDEDAAIEAMRDETLFNAIDQRTAWKIDFIICKSRPFSQQEFGRKYRVTFEGLTLWIATLEDVLIAKLEWASKGHSRRQIEDCAQLLRVRGMDLDRDYLSRWIATLGVDSQWQAAVNASQQT
jgi:predicted nucleotidyltransferase